MIQCYFPACYYIYLLKLLQKCCERIDFAAFIKLTEFEISLTSISLERLILIRPLSIPTKIFFGRRIYQKIEIEKYLK